MVLHCIHVVPTALILPPCGIPQATTKRQLKMRVGAFPQRQRTCPQRPLTQRVVPTLGHLLVRLPPLVDRAGGQRVPPEEREILASPSRRLRLLPRGPSGQAASAREAMARQVARPRQSIRHRKPRRKRRVCRTRMEARPPLVRLPFPLGMGSDRVGLGTLLHHRRHQHLVRRGPRCRVMRQCRRRHLRQ